MQDGRRETPWKEITFFLLTLGVVLLCALILRPFSSGIIGAIVLAVVTRRPYDWLATKDKKPLYLFRNCSRPHHHRRYRPHLLSRAGAGPAGTQRRQRSPQRARPGENSQTSSPIDPRWLHKSRPSPAPSTSTTPLVPPLPISEETLPASSATLSASSPSSSCCSSSCSSSSATAR